MLISQDKLPLNAICILTPQVQQEIGYCPQFDAILDQMTGRETLRMFARLRGVPESAIEEHITDLAEQLIVTPHLDNLVGNYRSDPWATPAALMVNVNYESSVLFLHVLYVKVNRCMHYISNELSCKHRIAFKSRLEDMLQSFSCMILAIQKSGRRPSLFYLLTLL